MCENIKKYLGARTYKDTKSLAEGVYINLII